MKRNILLAFALLLTASVDAQEITISGSNITEKDNQVTVTFAAMPGHIASNEKLTITPVLYSVSGTKTLRPIVVVGRNRAISDKRMGESHTKTVLRASSNTTTTTNCWSTTLVMPYHHTRYYATRFTTSILTSEVLGFRLTTW